MYCNIINSIYIILSFLLNFDYYIQDSVLTTLPHIGHFLAALTCGLLIDHVRESKIVSTTTARKLVVYTGKTRAPVKICSSINMMKIALINFFYSSLHSCCVTIRRRICRLSSVRGRLVGYRSSFGVRHGTGRGTCCYCRPRACRITCMCSSRVCALFNFGGGWFVGC